jgi:hypothetical protein
MSFDKDLNDDLIKRVRYWAVYTQQGMEATFPDAFCTISGKKDEARFISWKTSEFYNKIKSKAVPVPEEWQSMLPNGVYTTPDGMTIEAIDDPASQYLLVDFEVVARYQKEDLRLDVRQSQFYLDGAAFFEKQLGLSRPGGGGGRAIRVKGSQGGDPTKTAAETDGRGKQPTSRGAIETGE